MITQEQRAEVEWLARDVSATELMNNNDADGIVEFVGDWIEDNVSYDTEDEWSELCFVFYEFWGCQDIPSHTPEWTQFWTDKVREEE